MTQRSRIALGLWLLLGGCSSHQCQLDDDLRLFAGDGAIDCGIAGVKTDRAAVDQCASEAFGAHKAFMARYADADGSKLVTAVASNSDGALKIFRWNSPCGDSSCSSVTDVQECVVPTLKMMTSDDANVLPFDCGSLGLPERICN